MEQMEESDLTPSQAEIHQWLSEVNRCLQLTVENLGKLKDAKVLSDVLTDLNRLRAAEMQADVNHQAALLLASAAAEAVYYFQNQRLALEKELREGGAGPVPQQVAAL